MKVNEIFRSIEGEGIRAGVPAVFIRLFGCNLACSYCDSVYACKGDSYVHLSISEILDRVRKVSQGCKQVTVTGGEPLIHPGIEKLLGALLREGYEVNVETNGSKDIICYPEYEDKLFYTMDYKCSSSGMNKFMNIERLNTLTSNDVLKFVVGSVDDLNEALSVIEQLESEPQIFFSPIFGKIEAKDIVDYILQKRLYHCRVQLQLHKYIWDPNMRGV